MLNEGLSQAEIARRTGVSRAQVRDWQRSGIEAVLSSPMRTASAREPHPVDECDAMIDVPIAPYVYLLGQYLGDGCISTKWRGHPKLRISTCDDYPVIRSECIAAIRAVAPSSGIGVIQREGCSEVAASSMHWPLSLPQHGPGVKHRGDPGSHHGSGIAFALEIRPDLLVAWPHSLGWLSSDEQSGNPRQALPVPALLLHE